MSKLPYTPDWGRVSVVTGYQVVYCPGHPHAWSSGYVYSHRVLVEQKLGRVLDVYEHVHHKDGNRLNNKLSNLELLTKSEHAKKHARPITLVNLICAECSREFTRRKGNDPKAKGTTNAFCSKHCSGKFNAKNGGFNRRTYPIPKHGTYGRYRKGCRCPSCRKAQSDRLKSYRNSIRQS